YGLDNISLPETTGTDYLAEHPEHDINKFQNIIRHMLVNKGYYEVVTNSLTSQALYDRINIAQKAEPVVLLNKLSEEIDRMRQNMLYSLLEVAAHNINRKQKDLKLFEFGKTYHKSGDAYEENAHLVLLLTGNVQAESWREKSRTVDIYDLSQNLAEIIARTAKIKTTEEHLSNDYIEYGLKVSTNKQQLAYLGKVNEKLLKHFDIKQEIFFADIDADLLFSLTKHNIVFKELPKFPEVRRDLSLVLDKTVTFESLKKIAISTEQKLIRKINVFDVYEGKNIPEDKKAYALSFILQNENKTLTDQEIDGVMLNLMERFEKELGAVIRK
ncbi:MAG TPA: phenylalanine--tRNA ligase subunit beta, partial [Cyclobacteriaceae bacterium]|nr:phenylalanine--tRNA ligase subunit beta [Cyclobacteriaceae bacterium]